ncbi:MAG: insulinase family protein [Bacteroidales bacterium]|nr:insulinase family protein [Bacteroidales bacterium]
MSKRVLLIVSTFIIAFLSVFSANAQPTSDIPADVPFSIDENVITGTLENGFSYYIRQNKKPVDRAQFWLVVNAGSVLEEPGQNGLAHFTEHMCFNGTKNFEKKAIIHYLQSIGMKFGPEINAFTSHDVTNYMLQNVPVDKKENIDTSLMILYDWAHLVAFDPDEIDAERGVIHEEWRSGFQASRRIQNKLFKVLFEGSKYANHDVIGSMDVVDNFKHERLIQFYNDWYRPDLQAIVAVGDFDVQEIEQKIIKMFSSIALKEDAPGRETIDIPAHDETKAAVITDKEEKYMLARLYYKHPAVKDKSTTGYYRDNLQRQLYNTMFGARLAELTKNPDAPFIFAMSSYNKLVRSTDAYQTIAVAKTDVGEAIKALLVENMRVKQHGFTASELDRAKKELLARYETTYKERDKTESSAYCWEYYAHFLENEPIPGIAAEYEMAQQFVPAITLEEINALAKKWITDKNRVVVASGPESAKEMLPTEEQLLAIVEDAEDEVVEPYMDVVLDKPLISETVTPGTIVKEKRDKKYGYTTWELDNGATVVLKSTDFKEDEIIFKAFSKGGTSIYDNDDLITAMFTSDVIEQSGIGEFDIIQLEKMLSDKILRIYPFINEYNEGFNGRTRPEDLGTFMELIYLYFKNPRIDPDAFATFMSRQVTMLQNKANDPNAVFSDSLTNIMYQYNFRKRPMSVDILKEADFQKMMPIYNERFSGVDDFTFVFVGNIDANTLKPYVLKYIGSLPSGVANENWVDRNVNLVDGVVKKKIYLEMENPMATVLISMHGNFGYSWEERVMLSAINDILDVRYTETVREEESGTYGVGTYTMQSAYPIGNYRLITYFNAAPENAERLAQIIYREINDLKTNGPKQKEIDNVVSNKLKEHAENLEKNRYWLSALQFNIEHNQDVIDSKKYQKILNKLSPKMIQKAVNKYYSGDNVVEIILLPKE